MTESKCFERVQREDGLWNFLKPDGMLLCEEWFKSARGFVRSVKMKDGKCYYLKTDGTLIKVIEDV